MKRIDSHTHFDEWVDSDKVDLIRRHEITVVSWSFARHRPETIDDFELYLGWQAARCQVARAAGVEVYRVIGIHPRSIPVVCEADPTLISSMKPLLREAARMKDVVGIGETGLETGSDLEKRVFQLHIELAKELGLPLCVHTPRTNKAGIYPEIEALLESSSPDAMRIVIDHLTIPELVDRVLARRWWAGITIAFSKSTPQDAALMINARAEHAHHIMLNSDAAQTATIEEYQAFIDTTARIDLEAHAVLGDTAAHFFGLNVS